MPTNLHKLTTCISSILAALECPICLDTIPPPAHQCVNGHLICVRCRVQTDKCPICRVRFSRGRSLLADQVFNALHESFDERTQNNSEKSRSRPRTLRERLFGPRAKSSETSSMRCKTGNSVAPPQLLVHSPTNKLLSRLIGKASSVDNLSQNSKHERHRNDSLNTFTAELRAKSLSTGEICDPASAALSHPTSLLSLNSHQRAESFHGSSESLSHPPEDLFHCPWSATCQVLMTRDSILEHCRSSCHPGPLVQYSGPRAELQIPSRYEDTAIVALNGYGHQFLIKMYQQQEGDILLWNWLLGNSEDSKSFQLQITLMESNKMYFIPTFSLISISFSEALRSNHTIKIKQNLFEAGSTLHLKVELKKINPLSVKF